MPFKHRGTSHLSLKKREEARSAEQKFEVVGSAKRSAMDAERAQTAFLEKNMSKALKNEKAAVTAEEHTEKEATTKSLKKSASSTIKKEKKAVAMLRGGELEGGAIEGGDLEGGAIEGGAIEGGAIEGGAIEGGAIEGGAIEGGKLEGGSIEGGELEGGKRGVAKSPVAAAKRAAKETYYLAVEEKTGHILGSSKARKARRSASRSPRSPKHKHLKKDGSPRAKRAPTEFNKSFKKFVEEHPDVPVKERMAAHARWWNNRNRM